MTAFSSLALGGLVALAVSAMLAFAPMKLVREASGARAVWRDHLLLFAGASLLAGSAIFIHEGLGPYRMAQDSAVIACAAATLYYDARYLVIPDLAQAVLAIAGLAHVAVLGWGPAAIGAALCAGMLAAVAWAYRRYSGVEGLGLADIKLAAVFGLLLGPEAGVWMICGAACSASVFGLWRRRTNSEDGPLLIPFGAFLAFFGVGIFLSCA